MSRRNIHDYPLHLEERIAVVREMCARSPEQLTRDEHHAFMRRLMDICDGDRRSVPKEQRTLVRIPFKFAWGKPKEEP